MNILQAPQLLGSLQFVGANSVGPKITMILTSVLLTPAKALAMIGDNWGEIDLDGEALADETGSFGTLAEAGAAVASPNVGNYYIGKGIVSWQAQGAGGYVDLGNVSKFEFQPEIKTLPHFSSRFGTKTKDLEIVLEKSAKVTMTMDEWTIANLQLFLMGQ